MQGLELASVSRAAEEAETLGFVDFEKCQNTLKKQSRKITHRDFIRILTYLSLPKIRKSSRSGVNSDPISTWAVQVSAEVDYATGVDLWCSRVQ